MPRAVLEERVAALEKQVRALLADHAGWDGRRIGGVREVPSPEMI